MNPERWHQVEQIYNSVLEHSPEERAAFLGRAKDIPHLWGGKAAGATEDTEDR